MSYVRAFRVFRVPKSEGSGIMTEDRRLSAEESKGELLVYQSKNGQIKLEVRLENETVWLTQKMMAELFQVGVNTINYHIKEIYECGELNWEATIRKFRIVRMEERRQVARQVDFYNLDWRGDEVRKADVTIAKNFSSVSSISWFKTADR